MIQKMTAALMARGPRRGTWSHFWGSMFLALLAGLVFYFTRYGF